MLPSCFDPSALCIQDVSSAGFFVIPEYVAGTILALTACFAAFAFYRRSKRSKHKAF